MTQPSDRLIGGELARPDGVEKLLDGFSVQRKVRLPNRGGTYHRDTELAVSAEKGLRCRTPARSARAARGRGMGPAVLPARNVIAIALILLERRGVEDAEHILAQAHWRAPAALTARLPVERVDVLQHG